MKILFAMSSPEYLRFYDSTVVELARRGHDIGIAVGAVRDSKPGKIEAIASLGARVSFAGVIPTRADRWTSLVRAVRGTMDFVRYLHPRLSSAALLRARVKRLALPWILNSVDRLASLSAERTSKVMNGLAAVERAIPVARSLRRFLDEHGPDLLLVTPLVEPASDQVDLVRAAKARGVRVATLVASWDNLTNKGDLRIATDLITVWNDAQKREAVELHRVTPEKVVVTGAPSFDRWFDRTPHLGREDFCRQVGLPTAKPFVLFTGSSIFIARADVETPFVRRWIEALRSSEDPLVRGLAVLVRPHPYNGKAWNPEALSDLVDVAVWPRGGYDPADERNRAAFFDSMYHAEAVVGINTSAMIEAAIVGRPVLSIEAPEFAGTQDGTLHYRYLLPENGGFLRIAATLGEHARQLSTLLGSRDTTKAELSRFVEAFVRPHGLDRPVTPVLADALEQYGRSPSPAPARPTMAAYALRVGLYPLAWLAPLFPPETYRRHGHQRYVREGWQQVNRQRRLLFRRLKEFPGRTAVLVRKRGRRALRLAIEALPGVVLAPARRVRRALRATRYHAGVFARRVRGAPTE